MAFSIFGFEIKRKQKTEQIDNAPSFAPEIKDDGALVVSTGAFGGMQGSFIDLDGTAKSEAELITKYREISQHPEIESAIDHIANEAIDSDADEPASLDLDNLETVSPQFKQILMEEFSNVLRLLNFNGECYDLFRRWYIDGRMYYHIIINPDDPRVGIQEIRYIDPRKIRKVREVVRTRAAEDINILVNQVVTEYFIYNDKGFSPQTALNYSLPFDPSLSTGAIKIAVDAIVHVTSGLMDPSNRLVYSYLQKAIKPLNQLRILEDATIIYRISRAPERRIFYIDVGNLPKAKAEQVLYENMIRHKNKVVYNQSTGEVVDDRKYMTMIEDYWFARREGSQGTQVTSLPAGQNLGEMDDVLYFQKKLFQALNVPVSRLQPGEAGFNLGRAAEISRDEVNFTKFVGRLRKRFSQLMMELFKKQLILKNIIALEDWEQIQQKINIDFAIDNHFEELKEAEILQNRLNIVQQIAPFVGQYFSMAFVRKNVLRMTEQDVEQTAMEIQQEIATGQFIPPMANPESGEIMPGGPGVASIPKTTINGGS